MTTTKTKHMLRQVLLERPTGNGVAQDVFWIHNDLAKVNKRVQDEDGTIWTIKEVYNAKDFEDLDKLYSAWSRWKDVLGG